MEIAVIAFLSAGGGFALGVFFEDVRHELRRRGGAR